MGYRWWCAAGSVARCSYGFYDRSYQPGEATQAEALGMVMMCAGTAVWFEVSYLISAMVLGTVVANFAKHCDRPFHAVEKMEWPF